MSQVFSHDKPRGDRGRNEGRSSDLIVGLAVLFATMSGAGCAVDATIVEDEPVESVSQKWPLDGQNGIPPAVLVGGLLGPESMLSSGITTPVDASLIRLCETFDGVKCALKEQWAHWLNQPPSSPGDEAPTLRRYLLSALVQGSLGPEVTVIVAPGDEIRGMFGTAAWWTGSSLDKEGQELMSAFIAVKVNALGATVPIGIVGPGPGVEASKPIVDPAFTFQEAVFGGNLFSQNPQIFACTGAQNSGGSDVIGLDQRICSKPGNPCNITGLGPCQMWCGKWDGVGIPTGEHCAEMKDNQGAKWTHPITTYLRVANPG